MHKHNLTSQQQQQFHEQGFVVLKNALAASDIAALRSAALKIVDEFDISDLTKSDPAPFASSRDYDIKIDTFEDLAFVGVAKRITAVLTPTIVDGKITSIKITMNVKCTIKICFL